MPHAEDTEDSNSNKDADKPSAGASLPPTREKSEANVDDLLADLNRIPLFMTSLDETDGDGGSNPHLDALRALQYEGTKFEIATNFREQGNECARRKDWHNARDFYTQGLDMLRGKTGGKSDATATNGGDDPLRRKLEGDVGEREVEWLDRGGDEGDEMSKVVDLEEEEEKERHCEELCCVNRALCNLELKNYGSTVRDCSRALATNPGNTKALYRSAVALTALDKIEPALHAGAIGLGLVTQANDQAMIALFQSVRGQAQKRGAYLSNLARERSARESRKRLEAAKLSQALKQRGVVVKQTTTQQPDMEDAQVALADLLDPDSELRTPVLLLYPSAAQSELVKEVKEGDCVGDVLAMVLPVPFEGGEELGGADGAQVECFVETGAGGLRKVGKRVHWRKVIADGGAVLKDGLIAVNVVPRGRVDAWVAEWKKMNRR